MQSSRRAFLFGRRLPRTPWDMFRQRLARAAHGPLEELDAAPPGRARLRPARPEDVRHARALCVEYGVALVLAGTDASGAPAGRAVLEVDPSALTELAPGPRAGQWRAQPGCRAADLAAAGLPQFAQAPPAQTLAGWLAGAGAWPPGGTAASGLVRIDLLLSDGTAETLGPFGQDDVQPLRSAAVQRLVPALFQLAGSADAAACRAHAAWPCRYRLDALAPEPPAGVNLAQLLLGHGGTLAWVEGALLAPGQAAGAVAAAPAPPPGVAAAAHRLAMRVQDAFDPQGLYAP